MGAAQQVCKISGSALAVIVHELYTLKSSKEVIYNKSKNKGM